MGKMTMKISFKFREDANKHLNQLKDAMPKAKHFIQKTKRDKDYPFEIVTIHKGKRYYSGALRAKDNITKKIRKLLTK